jgi:hypothetical protein
MNETDKANEIDKEIRESNALRIYNRIRYLQNVFYIYERNYKELETTLTTFRTPEIIIPFFDEKKGDDFNILINELRRYFHNYVASAATLRSHAQIIIPEAYNPSEFFTEYQNKVDIEFKYEPLSVFVQDLRNYTLHRSLPATYSQIQFHQNEQTKQSMPTARAYLDKESLLQGYDKWTRASKKYLAEAPDEIDLSDLINNHHDKFASFYNWLNNRLNEIHSDELLWLQTKSNELRMILEPIFKQS